MGKGPRLAAAITSLALLGLGLWPQAAQPVPLQPLQSVASVSTLASGRTKGDLAPRGAVPVWNHVETRLWDRDANGALSWSEWRHGVLRLRLFEAFDTNGDGVAEDAELCGGLMAQLDLDGDERVSEAELRHTAAPWVGELPDFRELDADQDGTLGYAELGHGLSSSLLSAWDDDADRLLNEVEVLRGLMATWDRNSDGILLVDERPGQPPLAARVSGTQPLP